MRSFTVASIPKRVLASVIDLAAVLLFLYPVFVLTESQWVPFLLFFAVTCCYHVRSLTSHTKASVGQKIAKICVATLSGERITVRAAFDRTASQFLCPTISLLLMQILNLFDGEAWLLSLVLILQAMVMFLWAYWYIFAIFSRNSQTFHDVLHDTVVVEQMLDKKNHETEK